MHQPNEEEEKSTITEVFDYFMNEGNCKFCALDAAMEAQVPEFVTTVQPFPKSCVNFYYVFSAN
jgi:hypothetical protein